LKDLAALIADISADRESGATEILQRAIDVLRQAMSTSAAERVKIGGAICRAQPGMASLWNAALAATNDVGQPARFERFVHRVLRAPSALARFTSQLFADSEGPRRVSQQSRLSLVTLSNSASVRHAFVTLASSRPLRVACAEGRPALEGRRMAAGLAQAGIAVTLFSDGAIAEALADADAVVVGADAVASEWFVNKVGTRMLTAAAGMAGVPAYVIAAADKFCAPALAPFVSSRDGAPDEIWDSPPPSVAVRNPYFERVPLELVAAVITDGGIMPVPDVAAFCMSLEPATPTELVRQLARAISFS
jgi:translation initiation factor 2B subunit (eIF-2B alpha/beta/delta family)